MPKSCFCLKMIVFLQILHLLSYCLDKYLLKPYNTKIIYFSKNFIVIDKEYDLKINSNNNKEVTVQTFIRKQYPELTNKSLYHEFYFPHRLDFATSGVLCIPLHKEACRITSNAFSIRETKKYYIAIVRGLLSKEIVDIDIPIGEDLTQKCIHKMCTIDSKFCSKPRTARTILLVLDEGLYNNYPTTKVLIRPIAGRRHQIRVHCSSIGHTIVGDYTYSNRKDVQPFRMFLHSIRLVVPNCLESLDIKTQDPFVEVKNWKPLKKLNNLDSGFTKINGLSGT